MTWGWLDQGFEQLSKLHNPLLAQLISSGKLRLRFPNPNLDSVDRHAAYLVGGGIATHTSLCVVLPDTNPRRPAFLFAYSLLASWVRLRIADIGEPRPILYCGVRPGVREQLSQVTISGLGVTLDGIFDQLHLARGSTCGYGVSSGHNLPRVVTAFGPPHPAEILQQLKPLLVAVDLADATRANWLESLLNSARQHNVTVVAWSTNPLSEAVAQFRNVTKFPTCRSFSGHSDFGIEETSELLFQPFMTTEVRPLSISNTNNDHDANLRSAIDCLRTASVNAKGSLVQSALQIHWRLLRTLENLAVPLSFHESEAEHLWGLRSIAKLRETCAHFLESIARMEREIGRHLERSTALLDDTISHLSRVEPPLWAALTQLIHSEPPTGQARLIVFPSQARKELFSLALLAKLNITPQDLEPLRVWITSLSELQLFAENRLQLAGEASVLSIPDTLEIVPLLVGFPTIGQTPRLLPFFFSEEAAILVHSYQVGMLRAAIDRWDEGLSPNVLAIADVLNELCRRPQISYAPPTLPHRVSILQPHIIKTDLKTLSNAHPDAPGPIWDTPAIENELAYLLTDEDDESTFLQDRAASPDEAAIDDAISVDTAYEIAFSGGWSGHFADDHQINFVAPNTHRVEERFVRALRVGDAVLIIPNQPRQSLYALIISRIHQHPSIELHLALLGRWREDLQAGFQRWAAQRPDALGDLLRELNSAGSTITSRLALHFWLNGTTLCPSDEADLLRVSQILDLGFVRSRYRQIAGAASRIRGLHRGLSNRLNRWLNDRAQTITESHDAEVIDSSLGLTFGDLRSSLVIAEVVSIQQVSGPFLRDTLGYIQRAR